MLSHSFTNQRLEVPSSVADQRQPDLHVANDEMEKYQRKHKNGDTSTVTALFGDLSITDKTKPSSVLGVQSVKEFGFAALNNVFDKLDKDHDGYLGKHEIINGVKDPSIHGRDAQIVGTLYGNYDRLVHMSADSWFVDLSISRNDVKKLTKDDPRDFQNQLRFTASKVKRNASPEAQSVFVRSGESSVDISPDAIRQGGIGDCYFLATVGSIAKTNPDLLLKMIKNNNDGTYTVTFPGDTEHPVTIEAPTQTELMLFNSSGPSGTWAALLEKAYGQYRSETDHKGVGGFFESIKNYLEGKKQLPAEAADGGGCLGPAMELLTGNRSDFFLASLNSKEIGDMMDAALNGPERHAITAGTLPNSHSPMGFPSGHAYSIIAYRSTEYGGDVTIRNPWGNGFNTTNGTITITLDEFRKNFYCFNVQRPDQSAGN